MVKRRTINTATGREISGVSPDETAGQPLVTGLGSALESEPEPEREVESELELEPEPEPEPEPKLKSRSRSRPRPERSEPASMSQSGFPSTIVGRDLGHKPRRSVLPTLSGNEPPFVEIICLRPDVVKETGRVTGTEYTFEGGKPTLVDHRDVGYLKAMVRHSKSCCGGGPGETRLFIEKSEI